ncbi:MAG TPA: helix-turn-helix domain-containing protein [Kofleriaceae bacterium]|jgi:excisionase family DNA binding protein
MPAKKPPQVPLYVKLPSNAIDKLQRASQALGVPKKELVAGLVTRYVDPDTQQGLSALGALATRRIPPPNDGGPMIGSYSFQPYDPPEVMNAEQAGQFLQISDKNVIELAEAGKLPGKKLGPVWRFSREALVAWLSTPEVKK